MRHRFVGFVWCLGSHHHQGQQSPVVRKGRGLTERSSNEVSYFDWSAQPEKPEPIVEERESDWSEDMERWLKVEREDLMRKGQGDSAFCDSRIMDIASDYQFPMAYIADVLVDLGVNPPIRDTDILSDLVNGDQAYALLEALTTLDGTDFEDFYMSQTLEEAADLIDVPVSEVFNFCSDKGYSLPHGIQTQLRKDYFNDIVAALQDERKVLVPKPVNDDDDDSAFPDAILPKPYVHHKNNADGRSP